MNGSPRPTVAWRVEGDPQFLATIPRELLVQGAEPASGVMTLVLRVPSDHPAVARTEAMIRDMFARWSAGPAAAAMQALPAAVLDLGPPDPCIELCEIFSSDGAGDLFVADAGVLFVSLIGNMGVTMFDLAITRDGHLVGISGGSLYLIDACTAVVTLLGPSTLASGLAGPVPFGDDLFAAGPPLERISLPTTTPSTVGGSCCGAPPSWCGLSAGDISNSWADERLYTTLPCAACAGDMLVTVDPATGAILEEITCLEDPVTHQPLSDITGLTWSCGCFIYVGFRDSPRIYSVFLERLEIGGRLMSLPYSGTFGFASQPPNRLHPCFAPPSCDATADRPFGCSTVRLHANASDPQGDTLTYLWTSTCPDASFSPSATDANPTASVEAGCGTCTFEVTADDGHGHACNDSVEVVFEDVTPPVIDASALVACLWPPNHALVDIGLAVEATDDCAAPADIALSVTSITSDEATGSEPGSGGVAHCPDAVIDGLTVRLRAERSGASDGRVYRVTLRAVDPCGNAGEVVVEVRVPHDRRARGRGGSCAANDGGAPFDATRCE